MKTAVKLVGITKKAIRYSIPSIGILNDKFLDGLDWPADKEMVTFMFPRKAIKAGEPVKDMVSAGSYVCRTTWLVHKKKIRLGKPAGFAGGLALVPFKDRAEHMRFERAVDEKYFRKPFKKYLDPSYRAEAEDYYKNCLPQSQAISVRKEGRVVAMVTLAKITTASRLLKPLHWVTWIWVDPRLSAQQRQTTHYLLRGWLRESSSRYIGATVHAVNVRSQKWFLKAGFRPVRVFFSRRRG